MKNTPSKPNDSTPQRSDNARVAPAPTSERPATETRPYAKGVSVRLRADAIARGGVSLAGTDHRYPLVVIDVNEWAATVRGRSGREAHYIFTLLAPWVPSARRTESGAVEK